MDLTTPLTRTAAGLARRTLVPPLVVLDQRVVVPVLGARSPVHKVLAAVAGATSAVTSAPRPSPAPAARTAPTARDEDEATSDAMREATPADAPADAPAPAPDELTDDEQRRIEELTDQLLEEQGGENFVGELSDDELRRAQARIRAKQLIEEEDHRLGDETTGGS